MARETHSFDVDTQHRRVDDYRTLRITVYRDGESGWFCDNAILGCSRSFNVSRPVEAISLWLAEHDRSGRDYRRVEG